ncbi:hypothetical protein OIU84_005177 [Salix udensis]|uniref:Uncharacterized protein n=1 Tax=Salix udensis TaxID=889485 RepID=A0AAD6JW96_9ROSI|nr:hypothetical protein OIU84_005177 [Salix udensis]
MDGTKRRGYVWAISAGLNAAFAAIAAKFFSHQVLKYGLVVLFNVTMWGCYVNSLKALSSLQATVTKLCCEFPVFWSCWILFVQGDAISSVVCRCLAHCNWCGHTQQVKYRTQGKH